MAKTRSHSSHPNSCTTWQGWAWPPACRATRCTALGSLRAPPPPHAAHWQIAVPGAARPPTGRPARPPPTAPAPARDSGRPAVWSLALAILRAPLIVNNDPETRALRPVIAAGNGHAARAANVKLRVVDTVTPRPAFDNME